MVRCFKHKFHPLVGYLNLPLLSNLNKYFLLSMQLKTKKSIVSKTQKRVFFFLWPSSILNYEHLLRSKMKYDKLIKCSKKNINKIEGVQEWGLQTYSLCVQHGLGPALAPWRQSSNLAVLAPKLSKEPLMFLRFPLQQNVLWEILGAQNISEP